MQRIVPSAEASGERSSAPIRGGSGAAYGTTPTAEKAPELPAGVGKFRWWPFPRRYYVAIWAFLGFCNVYMLRVNLSIAILEMTKNVTIKFANGSEITIVGEFSSWTSFDQGVILSSFFYGYIITQLPGGWISSKIGGKLPYGVGIAGTALFTLLTPVFTSLGKNVLITARVIEGLLEGVTYPSIHALWSHWAPPQEKTRLATIAFSGSYFGTVIAMPLSAALAEAYGWRSVFYFFGIVALLWCAGWFWTVSETPARDKRITNDELQYIQTSIGFSFQEVSLLKELHLTAEKAQSALHDGDAGLCRANRRRQNSGLKTPWSKIFTSLPVWAIVVAHFTENWGFYTMITCLPHYVEDVTKMKLSKTGFVAAVPYLLMGIIVQLGGQLADYLRQKRQISTIIVRKSFNCFGFLAQAIFIWAAAYSMENPTASIACVSLAIGIGGFAWSGFSVNHLDIAPQFAGILMGISNTFATIPGILTPVIVGTIVKDDGLSRTRLEWQLVFHICAGVYLLGAAFYAAFASGSRQPWADLHGGYTAHLDDLRETLEGSDRENLD